jgi:orotate phosphoribosyltransferase
MDISEKVSLILLKINAVTLNPKKPYRYASGILSPVYTDCRVLISFPKERKIIRDLYIEAIKQAGNFDVIAGTATAGIPHAAWIAEKMGLPMIYVRGSSKDHGKGNQIEGILRKGQTVVIIEDLISTSSSSIDSAIAIRNTGAKVSHIFAITTYQMKKAKVNLKQNKLKLHTLTTFAETVKAAEEMNLITNSEKEVILKWTKDPPNWGKQMGYE